MRLFRVARTPDLTPFFGTSAAGSTGTCTPVQGKGALTATALDSMKVGVDRDPGYGIPMALSAVQHAL